MALPTQYVRDPAIQRGLFFASIGTLTDTSLYQGFASIGTAIDTSLYRGFVRYLAAAPGLRPRGFQIDWPIAARVFSWLAHSVA